MPNLRHYLGLSVLILMALNVHAATKQILIVAVGDSTTAGTPFFRSALEVPPDGEGDPEGQYIYWMMHKRPEWKILNYGIPGETSDQIRARFADALWKSPRYVIILAGVNDINQGLPLINIEKNLSQMYKDAQAKSVLPVAATVPPFDHMTPLQMEKLDRLNRWITTMAEKMRIPIADLNAVTRDSQDPYQLESSPDGLHPDIGLYRKMGLALVEAIDPIEKAWR